MSLRRYEVSFVRADGRRLRGPLMNKKGLKKFVDFMEKLSGDNSYLTLTLNNHKFFVPSETFKNGHVELRPVGFIYSFIRALRSR